MKTEAGNGKPEKPWLFRKGQSGNPGGKPKNGREEGELDLLRAMRWVMKRKESQDRTQLQKECRARLKEDHKGFMSHWADLEKARLARAAKAGNAAPKEKPPAEPEGDEGTERLLGLIGKLQDDFHVKQAKEDAELAARPDAAQIAATLQDSLQGALEREAMWKRQVEELRERVKELESSAARASGRPASREAHA
jgi:hypothetical protein